MAKVNPTTYRLIAEDLARVDPAIKPIDLTRPDVAAAVLLKLTSLPEVMKSLTAGNPRSLLMFNALKAVAHEGATVSYEQSGAPMEIIEGNRFGDREPESMKGLLQWAETDPEWMAARFDKDHPDHREVSAEYSEIMDVIHRPLEGSADAEGGGNQPVAVEAAPPVSVLLSPMARADQLRADPSFLDDKHPAHTATIAAISAEYERAYPQAPEPVDAAPAALPAFMAKDDPRLADIQARMAEAIRRPDLPDMTPLARADYLSRLPAYHNKMDPGHSAAVQEAQSAFATAYPEPANDIGGGGE